MPALSVRLLYAVFFVSGAAALIYQITWIRSLSLVFGGSHLAVATVVSVFMGGLALGSMLAGRYLHRHRSGLRLYAMLELGIALGALVFQLLLQAYPTIYTVLVLPAPEFPPYLTLVRVALCVAALLPITTLMGATLPLIVDFCAERPAELGRRLSALYAINTAGAVFGVLLAGFVLLPTMAISGTIAVAFSANLLAAMAAWWLSRHDLPLQDISTNATSPGFGHSAEGLASDGLGPFLLWGSALSGFCALAYELLWTRVLVVGLGATDYGFSAILAAFLVGIGAGSALYNRLREHLRPGIRLFAVTQLLIGTAIAFSVTRLYDLPGIYVALQQTLVSFGADRFYARQLANLAVAFFYLGLPALLMGVSFPLAGELYGRYCRSAATAVGWVASANTLGAIVGAAFAGFALIPLAGIERAIHLVIVVNLSFGLFLLLRTSRLGSFTLLVPLAGVGVAVTLVVMPHWFRAWDDSFFAVYRSNRPELFTSTERIDQAVKAYRVLYYGEGNTSIVAATQLGKLKIFSTNGRVEATSDLQDAQNQFALGHLPTLLHPDPREVLVVGGGSGMTLGATSVHPSVTRVTLAELEPKVLGVINVFGDLNHQVLSSPKLQVVINDGRNHLLTTRQRYDVITSDPIHPWFRGAGYLYTQEYFELAAARLKPGGLMAQWLPLYQMNTDHIRSVLASFAAAFRHVDVWLLYSDAVVIGSNEPIRLDLDRVDQLLARAPALAADLAKVNLGPSPETLLGYRVIGNSGVAALTRGARVNTDDNLFLEFDTPKAIGTLTEAANIGMFAAVRESAVPIMRSADPARLAAWVNYEKNRGPALIDQAQLSAQRRMGRAPEVRALALELDSVEKPNGRWQTVRSHLFPVAR